MNSRSTFTLLAAAALLVLGCGGGQKPDVPQAETAGMIPDTLPPARIVPGAAGSSAPAPESLQASMPAPAAQSPAAPAAPVIVDVRTQQEYDAGHIKGALLIPYDQMEQRWQELQQYQNQPVLLYCRSGRRSGLALEVLKGKGFTQLENGGGMDAMAAKGYQVVKE